MSRTKYQVTFMTASNLEEARTIATALVERGLAACVNMIETCRSIYKWEGKVVDDGEVLLIAKTKRADFARVEETVLDLHSYTVPEIIAVDLAAIADGYRGFLQDLLGD